MKKTARNNQQLVKQVKELLTQQPATAQFFHFEMFKFC